MSEAPLYCSHCGNRIKRSDHFCSVCGKENPSFTGSSYSSSSSSSTSSSSDPYNLLMTIGFILMIVSTVYWGIALIPLAWNIPFIFHVRRCMLERRRMSLGIKIAIIILTNVISGILFIIADEVYNKK